MLKFRDRMPTKEEAHLTPWMGSPVQTFLCCDVCGAEAKQGTHIITFDRATMRAFICCKGVCDSSVHTGWDELGEYLTIRIPHYSSGAKHEPK